MVKKVPLDNTEELYFETFEDFIEDGDKNAGLQIKRKQEKTKLFTNEFGKETIKASQQGNLKQLRKLYSILCHCDIENAQKYDLETHYRNSLDIALAEITKDFKTKLGKKLDKSTKWKSYEKKVRIFLKNTATLLSGAGIAPEVYINISNCLKKLAKLLKLFPNQAQILVGQISRIFVEQSADVKLAFLSFIKKAACVKSIEPGYALEVLFHAIAKKWKIMPSESQEDIELMRTYFIDLFSVNLEAGLQFVRNYANKLELYLAKASRGSAKSKIIYNWQFFNSISLISHLIISYPKQFSQISPSIIQILHNLFQANQAQKYSPLKLHIIKLLIILQYNLDRYIPGISSYVLEIITNPALQKRSKTNRCTEFSLASMLKVNKEQLTSDVFKEKIIEESCRALLEHIAYFGNSIAFPEVSLPIKLALKKSIKDTKNAAIKNKISHTVKLIEENSRFIEKKRNGIFGPIMAASNNIEGKIPLSTHKQGVSKDK
ncbi:unnamed protein product [Blepharisma stoltei]|uniref:Nucleolar complex protein 2 homolog n=1 Tax=Blepharisma stoltei TaxID=1481888 RepID=A0AAU9K167_9CILI|nr:unnamed protein product [Blepharisma stoltei]